MRSNTLVPFILLLLVACGAPRNTRRVVTAPAETPAPLVLAPVARSASDGAPPLPPPAPVYLQYAWPNGATCLQEIRRSDALEQGPMVASRVVTQGQGLVQSFQGEDGAWRVNWSNRGANAAHRPLPSALLQGLSEAQMRVTPTLVLTADGKDVAEVQDVDLSDRVDGLVQEAAAYGSISQSFWVKNLPNLLSEAALSDTWRSQWSDSWGLVYNHDWVAGETQVLRSPVTDDVISFTYQDVVPCKFNEDEPLCVRITFESEPSAKTRLRLTEQSDARLRGILPPNHQDAPLLTVNGARSGELVLEARTGLPWRWSSNAREHYVFGMGEDRTTDIAHHRDVEMSCDWRVAE